MAKALLNNNITGSTYWHTHGDGEVTVEKVYDAEPALEHAKRMRNEVKQTGELRKAMSVPLPLLYQWVREGKLGEEAFATGKIIVDKQTLAKLFAEYDGLRCVDKL